MGRNHDEVLRVYVSQETKEQTKQKADQTGMSASALLRHKLKTEILDQQEARA